MVRRPAGEEHHPLQAADLLLAQVQAVELQLAVVEPLADRLGDRVGLLPDLLEHERLEALLLGGVVVPLDLLHLALDRRAVAGEERGAVGAGDHDLVVEHVLHPARLGQERGDRGGHEHLAVPHADHERAAAPRGDEHAGAVAMGDREGEVAVEALVGLVHGLDQVAGVALLDQVGDRLGVGVGVVDVAGGGELAPQRRVVLDDAVVHDGDARALAGLDRVRVGLDHAAVGGPAGVREPGRGGMRLGADRVAQHGDLPHPARDVGLAVDQADAGRVVAAVLQPLEPREEELLARPATHISDDSTHSAHSDLGLDDPDQMVAHLRAERVILRLNHYTHDRLGARCAQHDPAVVPELRLGGRRPPARSAATRPAPCDRPARPRGAAGTARSGRRAPSSTSPGGRARRAA